MHRFSKKKKPGGLKHSRREQEQQLKVLQLNTTFRFFFLWSSVEKHLLPPTRALGSLV